jgi:hypothetical protein
MFEAFLNWRTENQIDTIMTNYKCEELPAIIDAYPHAYYGCDKIGRPIYYDRIGSIDIVKIFQAAPTDTIFKDFYYEWEKTCKLRMYASSILYDK